MGRRPGTWLAHRGLALLLAASPALAPAAEFQVGVDAYERKDFAAARTVFLDLAALGDGPSQYNLGAMALRGEGVSQDRAEAVGWILAARENGHDPTPRGLEDLRGKLTEDERARADAIVARYGRSALARTVLPREPRKPTDTLTAPRLVSAPRIEYPERWGEHSSALLIVQAVIGEDGRPRDPRVVVSIPPIGEGGRGFVEAFLRGILARRYEPAREDGRPVEVRWWFRAAFRPYETTQRGSSTPHDATDMLDRHRVEQIDAAAAAGDPRALFIAAILDMASGRKCPRSSACEDPRTRILSAAQAGVPEAQLFVGRELSWGGEHARALPWLARASTSGLPGAQVDYGLALLHAPEPRYDEAHALLVRGVEGGDPVAVRRAIATLACARDVRVRSPETAFAMSERVAFDDDPDPTTAEAVAAARAAVGEFSRAADAQRFAVKRAKKLGWDVSAMEARLRDYRAERACPDPEPADPVEPLPPIH